MTRLLVAAFLAAHGAIHIFMYLSKPSTTNPPPFDARHSWALEGLHVPAVGVRAFSVAFSVATSALLVYSSLALAADRPMWVGLAGAGAAIGLALKVFYFHPWLSAGVALDVALLVALASEWPPSLF